MPDYRGDRHLAGLDYAKKVLSIEVIHGINDFLRFLGGSQRITFKVRS